MKFALLVGVLLCTIETVETEVRKIIKKNSAILSANSLTNPISLIISSGCLRKQIVHLFKDGFR
ncbi:MAG: hypothetical protein ACKO90_38845, partial [Microcystis panniformis]